VYLQAETPEALTVLQLLQGIDVALYFPQESLAGLVGVKSGPPLTVRRVVIHQIHSGAKRFRGQVEVQSQQEQQLHQIVNGTSLGEESTETRGSQVVEARSSFEAIALALWYGATIVVNSALLRDPEVSLEASDIRTSFSDFVEIRPVPKPGSAASIPTFNWDLDTSLEVSRLQQQLQLAINEGNEQAKLRILRQLGKGEQDATVLKSQR